MKFRQRITLICEGSSCKTEIRTTLTVKQSVLGREEQIQCPGHWMRTDGNLHLCPVCKKRYLKGLE